MEDFNGIAGQMRNSIWLASEDFEDGQVIILTIDKVVSFKDEVMADGRKASGYGLRFKETKRGLVINATNRKMLIAMYGVKVAEWIGKKISLHVIDGVRSPKGGTCKGIRIKQ